LPDFVLKNIEDIEQWNMGMCQKVKALRAEQGSDLSSRPVIYESLEQGIAKHGSPRPSDEMDKTIASETLDSVIAGHETTDLTIAYLTYELSLRPNLQAKLREEVRSLSPPIYFASTSEHELPVARSIDALPLLDAVIQETLRHYPAAPAPLPRVTPRGGTTVEGHITIPGSVRISACAYALHRNADVFPEPESWKPERWLDADQKQLVEMRRWSFAFGSGARICLGQHFALQGKRCPRL